MVARLARRTDFIFLESSISAGKSSYDKGQSQIAVTVTGPAHGPRPDSSMPITDPLKFRSWKRSGIIHHDVALGILPDAALSQQNCKACGEYLTDTAISHPIHRGTPMVNRGARTDRSHKPHPQQHGIAPWTCQSWRMRCNGIIRQTPQFPFQKSHEMPQECHRGP